MTAFIPYPWFLRMSRAIGLNIHFGRQHAQCIRHVVRVAGQCTVVDDNFLVHLLTPLVGGVGFTVDVGWQVACDIGCHVKIVGYYLSILSICCYAQLVGRACHIFRRALSTCAGRQWWTTVLVNCHHCELWGRMCLRGRRRGPGGSLDAACAGRLQRIFLHSEPSRGAAAI